MKKFSEIEYVRPDMEAEREKVRAYTKALKEAKSYEELRGLFMEEKTRGCLGDNGGSGAGKIYGGHQRFVL